jgi:hypothetical protein
VICAALGRFPGQSPEGMLNDIRRHSRFSVNEFEAIPTEPAIIIVSKTLMTPGFQVLPIEIGTPESTL